MKKTGSLIALIVFFTGSVYAAQLETTLRHKKIGVGERTTLTISFDAADSIKPVKVPQVKGLGIEYSGRQQSISMMNGVVNRKMAVTFTVTGKTVGIHTIPSFVFQVNNKQMLSVPLKVRVTRESVVQNQPGGFNPFGMFPGRQQTVTRTRATILTHEELSSEKAVLGKPVILRYFLLVPPGSSIRLLGVHRLPMVKNFMVKQVDEELEDTDISKDGRELVKTHLATFVLIPTATGTATMKGASMSIMDQGGRSFFSVSGERKVTFPDHVITSMDLPGADRPQDYTGEVGAFTLNVEQGPYEIKQYSEGIITVKVSGKGNFYTMKPPLVKGGDNLSITPGDDSANLGVEGDQVTGERIFRYRVFSEKPVNAKLRFVMPVYNHMSETYQVLQSEEVRVTVRPSMANRLKRGSIVNGDQENDNTFYSVIIAILLLVIIVLVAMGVFVRERLILRSALPQQPEKDEEQDPGNGMDQHFRDMDQAYGRGDQEAFLASVYSIIRQAAEKNSLSPEDSERVKHLMDACEKARYGGGSLERSFMDDAVELVNRLRDSGLFK